MMILLIKSLVTYM
jgi:hypothetical protein